MQLIDQVWSHQQDRYEKTWIAQSEKDINPGFDSDSAIGSQILVIDTGAMFIKNLSGKWQKCGSTEVIE